MTSKSLGFSTSTGIEHAPGERWVKERVGALRYRNEILSCRAERKISERWMTLKAAAGS
ncbi:MAG: hypothetical protein IPM35_41565 [Myxococcales bacterium]|nr:hypothetical protein [Myxococcales bacterium]